MSYTLSDALIGVRELSYDRFPTPVFVLKASGEKQVEVLSDKIRIYDNSAASTHSQELLFTTYTTLISLVEALSAFIPVAFTSYFKDTASPNTLMLTGGRKTLSEATFIFQKKYLTDGMIKAFMVDYATDILRIEDFTEAGLEALISELNKKAYGHFCLWVAISVVLERRLSEIAFQSINGTMFTDGTGVEGALPYADDGSINVNIGNVFSMSEQGGSSDDYFSEDYNRVGSENVLGDKNSFWFKLYLYLRDRLESKYKDFYFRNSNVLQSDLILDKYQDYRNWFSSWPWTQNPRASSMVRDIVNP